MKITPRPITAGDEIDQSRDISGVNKWARSSRSISLIMLVLGWFTIPAEVFLRRDFGQRWFTVVNFYAGLLLLIVLASLQFVFHFLSEAVHQFVAWLASAINPLYEEPEPSFVESLTDKSMLFILAAYILIGTFHLLKIKWRNRTNTALHSFDDGTSHLEFLAGYFMQVINALVSPIIDSFLRLLPRKEPSVHEFKLVNDRTAFTNTVVEPLILFALAYWLHGIVSLWLFISAVAVAIHANWKETAKLNKLLNFRDSIIEAKVMAHLKDEAVQTTVPARMIRQAADTLQTNPQVAPQLAAQYPDLMDIIETMNRDRSHLGNAN